MVYSISFEASKYQEIACTAEEDEVHSRLIADRWKGLGGNDVWFQMTGLGEPASKAEVEGRITKLIGDDPGGLAFWLPPRELADIVPILYSSPVIAFDQTLEVKAPMLINDIRNDGILVDYPWRLSESFIQKWLGDLNHQNKWPLLKHLENERMEIEIHGFKYLVSNPSDFCDYRVKIFYCMNWQCDIVDRQFSSGSWKNWESGTLKTRYYQIETGKEIVFKQMPSEHCLIFRVPEKPSQLFCTQIFKEQYDHCGLKGLEFKSIQILDK